MIDVVPINLFPARLFESRVQMDGVGGISLKHNPRLVCDSASNMPKSCGIWRSLLAETQDDFVDKGKGHAIG